MVLRCVIKKYSTSQYHYQELNCVCPVNVVSGAAMRNDGTIREDISIILPGSGVQYLSVCKSILPSPIFLEMEARKPYGYFTFPCTAWPQG